MAKKKPTKPPNRKPKAELIPKGYDTFLVELKQRIRTAQLRASLAVNRELIELYWQMGRDMNGTRITQAEIRLGLKLGGFLRR